MMRRYTSTNDPQCQLGISCMLNTEVGAVLAVIRRTVDPNVVSSAIILDDPPVQSLKKLRAVIFHTDWRETEPSVYLSPFLDVVESDDVPASATGASLSAILKILQFELFDDRSPGALSAVHSIVSAISSCKLERTDANNEDAIMMHTLQVLLALIRCPAGRLLSDHAVCTIVNTCFQIVQQSAYRSDLLQRTARHCLHEVIQTIFKHLPDLTALESDGVDLSELEQELGSVGGYGAQCMTRIFEYLCSMFKASEMGPEGYGSAGSEENMQVFALVLINTAIELGGKSIGSHPKLLCLIEDDLFYHLVHHASCSGPLVLSMICSTVLNLYLFLRRSLRLQLEAFFVHVLLCIGAGLNGPLLQEVAIETIISFCRQPTFLIEIFVNYDCDPIRYDILEEIGKILCRTAFPQGNANQMTPLQIQAFDGLVHVITTIADSMASTSDIPMPSGKEMYFLNVSEYDSVMDGAPPEPDSEEWVKFVRKRKYKKKKIKIAAEHYNRDEKKGLEYLNISNVVPSPPDPKALAYFFRYTPGLDKTKIGEYLGDHDEFHIQVLKEYVDTFDFTGLRADTAWRVFLQSFWIPGESQKIMRVVEACSSKIYEQQSSNRFANLDAVISLLYSVIMLNTDQHNLNVKKRMTLDDFIRNNRGTNGGKNFETEYLAEVFHSISTNEIKILSEEPVAVELDLNMWGEIIRRSYVVDPFILCDFQHELSREMFTIISGQSVATLAAIFDSTNDEDIRSKCVEGMISVARIAQYGLEDVLDELLSCLCKFTNLLNPYKCTEDTQAEFNESVKMRMATLALFTIANRFGDSIRGAWKNIVDCMIKLKRMQLLPQLDLVSSSDSVTPVSFESSQILHGRSETGVIFPSSQQGMGTSSLVSGMIGRFSEILSLETGAESMLNMSSESEMNMKLMEQCRIANIFTESAVLSDETLQYLGRALIFSAYGKGQKSSTITEENETVGFCWDLILTITTNNLHRFLAFWPQFHEAFVSIQQLPSVASSSFPERGIIAIFKIAHQILSSDVPRLDRAAEEIIFKSITIMWKMEKDILDMCHESLVDSVIMLITEHANNIQTFMGWRTLFTILQVSGRHPDTFDRALEAVMNLMNGEHVTRYNYICCVECAYNYICCVECAYNFVSQKIIIPLDKCGKLLTTLGGSVNHIARWHNNGFPDSNNNAENVGPNPMNLYVKLIDALRKICFIRREEIRTQALSEIKRCFQIAADELDLAPSTCLLFFNHTVLPMADEMHENTVEYSKKLGNERETTSMAITYVGTMNLLAEFYVMFLTKLNQGTDDFKTFWLGLLRRMNSWMKCKDYAEGASIEVRSGVPHVLKKMIQGMTEKGVLVPIEGDELWDSTYIQVNWLDPSVLHDLFPL